MTRFIICQLTHPNLIDSSYRYELYEYILFCKNTELEKRQMDRSFYMELQTISIQKCLSKYHLTIIID